MFGGGSQKLKALEYELRLTKLKLGEMEEERDDLKNLTLELQKVLSKMTTENKIRENENDVTVNIFFFVSLSFYVEYGCVYDGSGFGICTCVALWRMCVGLHIESFRVESLALFTNLPHSQIIHLFTHLPIHNRKTH